MDIFIAEYVNLLNDVSGKGSRYYKFQVKEGRKYYKVTQSTQMHNGGYSSNESVHAFVDKDTLDVYKPASWNAPAKGVRYNLNKDIDTLRQIADPYGSYLYAWR
jgi:hypothetical protein